MAAMDIGGDRPRKRRRQAAPRAGKRMRARAGRLGSRGELKFLDTVKANAASATTGTLLDDSINHVAQDASENGRIGRKIVVSSIHFLGNVAFGSTTVIGDMDQYLRIIVYLDRQANGAAATLADIVSTAGTVDVDSFRNLAQVGRFQILYDRRKRVSVDAIGQTAAGTFISAPQSYPWGFNKRVNIPIEFDSSAAGGEMTTITSNNIGVMTICQAAAVAPTVGYTARIRFRDG